MLLPAPPQYQVVLPPAASRDHPVDLYLCAHHLWASREALYRKHAAVYDTEGGLVAEGEDLIRS